MTDRLYLYDTTLRDGAQTRGVDFSTDDKAAIARALDDLGVDYIEGGWPGANPTDDRFFADPPTLKKSRLSAFGMTRKAGRSADNDPALAATLNSGAPVFCLVGKTWDFHVRDMLNVSLEDNLESISVSLTAAAARGEVHFDAEHYFDGFKANREYALSCVTAAYRAGARWIVLCDTNGGTLSHEITDIVTETARHIPPDHLGIHTHDDTGNAVANSIAAVRAGCRLVQGTLNGLGERCGNANLISLIPTLMVKMGYDVGLSVEDLKKLKPLSRMLDERLCRAPAADAPYVGERAFAHKGGLHASAIMKNPESYEHINPDIVGGQRLIIVSDQAGKSNMLARLRDLGIPVQPDDPRLTTLVDLVKTREADGYAYDGAEASFEMLVRRMLKQVKPYFDLIRFSVKDDKYHDPQTGTTTESEASVKLAIGGEILHVVAEGNGPVNALDNALRKALVMRYPVLEDLRLVDYRVRILKPHDATAAMPRVLIESGLYSRPDRTWSTIGVSTNIIEASFEALYDSYTYMLFTNEKRAA